jgi:hypothetical protein
MAKSLAAGVRAEISELHVIRKCFLLERVTLPLTAQLTSLLQAVVLERAKGDDRNGGCSCNPTCRKASEAQCAKAQLMHSSPPPIFNPAF